MSLLCGLVQHPHHLGQLPTITIIAHPAPWLQIALTIALLKHEPPTRRQGPLTPPKIRTGVLVQRGYAIWGAELHFRCNRQCNRRFRNETAAIPASEASTSARRRRKFFFGDSDPREKLTSNWQN